MSSVKRVMKQAAEARKRRAHSEDSIAIRSVVLTAVMVAAVAVIAQGAVPPATAAGTLILLPVGFFFSYVRRDQKNILLKVALAAALLFALGQFLSEVQYVNSVDQAREALASLFLWVQVIHSFDLPRLRDLSFSMGSGVVLMAEAGSLSLDTSFFLFVVLFAIPAAAWLFLSQEAVARRSSDDVKPRKTARAGAGERGIRRALAPARAVALTSSLALVAGTLVFVSLPRLPGARVPAPPFELSRGLTVPGFNGQVVNPGNTTTGAGDGIVGSFFNPDVYPGFGSGVDLRVRGTLSDEIVMKVRASRAAFWRGQAYDTFDGTQWTASDATTTGIGGDVPWKLPESDGYEQNYMPGYPMTQTFYVERQQPNLIFAAYRPMQIYFPAPTAQLDNYRSVRSPILLDEGLIYSVVSFVPDPRPQVLETSPAEWPEPFLDQYTQLPTDLPPRVVELAHRITDEEPTVYDKVEAVQSWLKNNTRYNLDIPADPEGVDAVDYFLFERRDGYCEHIASSMVVLLRAVGIPARFAVGFNSGERNPLTGFFEVRESDAHSWVEVYYSGRGWVEYDPTHEVPLANPGIRSAFAAPQLLAGLGRLIADITPEPVRRAFSAASSGVAAAAGWTVRSWPVVLALLMALMLLTIGIGRLGSRRRRGPPLTGATAAFASVCRSFAARGHPRRTSDTAREHLSKLLRDDPLAAEHRDDLKCILSAFEAERFGDGGARPDQHLVDACAEAAHRIADARTRLAR